MTFICHLVLGLMLITMLTITSSTSSYAASLAIASYTQCHVSQHFAISPYAHTMICLCTAMHNEVPFPCTMHMHVGLCSTNDSCTTPNARSHNIVLVCWLLHPCYATNLYAAYHHTMSSCFTNPATFQTNLVYAKTCTTTIAQA